MKRLLTFLTLLTVFIGVGWAGTMTFTATSKTAGTLSGAPSGVDYSLSGGNQWNSTNQGIQVTTGTSPFTATFSGLTSSYKVTKITVKYCTNASSGVGTISAKIGNTQVGNTFNVTKPSSGGTTLKTATLYDNSAGTAFNGQNFVITVTCSTNSVYFNSVTVEYSDNSGTDPQPTTYNVNIGSMTNGSVSASSTSGLSEGDPVTLTINPTNGYELESLTVDNADVTSNVSNNQYTFNMPDHDVDVDATFQVEQTSGNTQWVLTDPSNLSTNDIVLIVDKYSSRAMSNDNGTSAAPSATSVVLNSNKTLVTSGAATNLQWMVSKVSTNLYFTRPNSNAQLYCTNTNNGVRVGSNDNIAFQIKDDFLYNTGTYRYLGVYNNQDWRCYTSSTGNIATTEIAFYKKVEAGAHSISVGTITGEGTITPSETSANTDDQITVTAVPGTGYELTALAFNGNAIDITSTPYTFIMPNADVTLTATFSLKNYVVAYEVTPSTAAANSGNRVGLISGAPYDQQTQSSHSQMGTVVTIKLYTGNGWQIDNDNVSVAYTDANGNPATLTPTKGETNNDDGGYGTYFTFTMPASDVIINAAYLPYQPDLYILGNVNGGTHWNDGGIKMTFDPSANTYSIRIYASEENGYFRFYANGGNNGNPSYGAGGVNLNPLEGTQPKDLWKDGDANFCVPAGIYDIVVGQIYDDPTTNSNPNWWGQTTVTVTKVEPTFTFSPAAGEVYQGTEVTANSNLYDLLHAINSDVDETNITHEVSLDGTTFSSSVALNNTGSATVTGKATYGYIQPTATANYTVNEIPAGSEYTLVTDASVLADGDELVIMSVGSGSGYAMSTTQGDNNRPQTSTAIAVTNNKIVPTSDTQIITLEGQEGAWYFNVGDGYLYAASSSKNHLRTETTADDNAKATIAIGTGGAATITFQGSNTHNLLKYNSTNEIFSCYASGQNNVYLFRKATGMPKVATPTFTPAEGTYNEAQSVTIACATDGATILYSTDGTNYSTYTGAITISETTTIYAKATKNGMTESDVAQATYTIDTPIEPGEGEFALVTNGNQIIAGREYIIVYYDSEKQVAAGAFNSTYFVSENVTLSNNNTIATAGSDVKVFTLEDGSVSGTFYLKDTEGTYYTPNSSATGTTATKNNLYVNYNGGYVEIKAADGSATYAIAYNNSSPRFTAYKISSTSPTAGQRPVYLYYRESGLQKPVFTPNPGVYGIDVDVTITCPTDGATIYYTTDGSTPSIDNGTEYTGEIVVSQTTTFKAIAVKDGETSSVTEATYTISKSTDIETVQLTYSEPFTEGVGKFHVDNVSGFSPVWTLDGNYGIKGTSFSGGVNYAATSRFVSPIIDMTGATQPELTFSHQINSYFNDPTTQCKVFIRETSNGTSGTWVQIPITFSDPVAAGGWTNDLADIDLTNINGVSYADKKVQISFLYTNPTEGSGAGTWEIQNFVVADNSEYRMVNNIAEFLALDNGTKAKFKNPVTVLYDYAQYSSGSYHEYIWVKDESGYMQFFLIPTLNSSTETNLSAKAAYYENGDIIPAGFVVIKNYYQNGKYVQAYSAEALQADFLPASDKGLADPEHMDFTVLNGLDATNQDNIDTWCNHYITLEKIKITSKSDKNFSFANENGTVNACVGYNKYNGDGSLLKDGTTSADVTVPAAGNTYYNVTGIIQLWQGGWEFMPIEFTEWNAEEVTLRKLCADGVVNTEYTISNNLLGVYASADGTKLWVKDDTGQSIWPAAPDATYKDNFPIEADGNTRLDQAHYDQSNWCEIQLTAENASDFVGKIINGGSIQGTFSNKTNPTMTGVTLTNDDIYSAGSYAPNYYIPCNFYGNQSCQTSQHGQPGHGDFFFMTPKPQEYAMIVWAVWDSENDQFVVNENPQYNSHGFKGSFKVDLSMNQDPDIALHDGIDDNFAYNFSAIIRVNSSKAGSDLMVYPLDLNAPTDPATAIEKVETGNGVVKSVKYVNVAGMVSDTPFQGVNIVVTEYTDGTRTTSKMLKR